MKHLPAPLALAALALCATALHAADTRDTACRTTAECQAEALRNNLHGSLVAIVVRQGDNPDLVGLLEPSNHHFRACVRVCRLHDSYGGR